MPCYFLNISQELGIFPSPPDLCSRLRLQSLFPQSSFQLNCRIYQATNLQIIKQQNPSLCFLTCSSKGSDKWKQQQSGILQLLITSFLILCPLEKNRESHKHAMFCAPFHATKINNGMVQLSANQLPQLILQSFLPPQIMITIINSML